MILNGYVQGKYGYDKPLSLAASIGFEQNYSEVDGDSASSTELYALLSAISGAADRPGDCGHGVGGPERRCAGDRGRDPEDRRFFRGSVRSGVLRGKQGVMVPADNVQHLTLKDEVLDAIHAGKFHIYSISTIDEGIEVLTGTPAGERLEGGGYPEGTVHYLVEERLKDMARAAREFAKGRGTSPNVDEGDEQDDGGNGEGQKGEE